MNLLLDTQALAWWISVDPKLSSVAREAIENFDNAIFVSAVSIYEMSRKYRIGKWPEIAPFLTAYENVVENEGFRFLELNARAAHLAGALPGEHRDPFDRMIAAQALIGQMTLITNDSAMRELGAPTLW
jgi:PIN domain nuclease of toxin-antitoxin system